MAIIGEDGEPKFERKLAEYIYDIIITEVENYCMFRREIEGKSFLPAEDVRIAISSGADHVLDKLEDQGFIVKG